MVLNPEEVLLLQHTLKHLSRLSNTVLSEAVCACLATGELPPGMVRPPSPELKQLSEEEHAELASQSQELAARLPKLNLGTPKKRTGALSCISHTEVRHQVEHRIMLISFWVCALAHFLGFCDWRLTASRTVPHHLVNTLLLSRTGVKVC